jgi:hypothetical protein
MSKTGYEIGSRNVARALGVQPGSRPFRMLCGAAIRNGFT